MASLKIMIVSTVHKRQTMPPTVRMTDVIADVVLKSGVRGFSAIHWRVSDLLGLVGNPRLVELLLIGMGAKLGRALGSGAQSSWYHILLPVSKGPS